MGKPKPINMKRWICSCLHCGGKWVSRTEKLPLRCAKCKAPRWRDKIKWPRDDLRKVKP
jgi:hypothetical protein